MTKYFVQSGGIKNMPEQAKAYFKALFKGTGSNPNVLWCYFASPPEEFETQYVYYNKIFKNFLPEGIGLNNYNATLENFVTETKEADVIYIHGGSTKQLREHLDNFDLKKLFKNKIIGTNSVSTLVLSSAGWDSDYRVCMKGYGLLPIKTLVHYNAINYGSKDPRGPVDWVKAKKALEEYGESLPVHALEEGEFIVIEQ